MSDSELLSSNNHNARADSHAALATSRYVHRKILIRLFLGWIVLNIAIGGIVLWLEINRVKHFVHELALKESLSFSGESAHDLERLDSKARQHLTELAQQLVNQHFQVVELYDLDKQLQFESVRQGQEEAEHWINQYRHQFPQQGQFSHSFHLINGNLLLVILVPLKSQLDVPTGYFEGIYQVDKKTFDTIKDDLLRALAIVTVGITFTTLLMYPIILNLNRSLIILSGDLLKGNLELMNVLGCVIAERDSDTNTHNYRVTFYALRLGEAIGLSCEKIYDLIAGAFLHDVGKIGIRDPILLKPEKLTPEEFEVMKTHISLGVNILNKSSWLSNARDVVEFHHEKYDGTGYPYGLKGEAIPLNARIFTVADVFDALTSKRPYKDSWKLDDAIALLERDSGTHFDPQLVRVFAKIAPRLEMEINRLKESEVEIMMQQIIARYVLSGVCECSDATRV